MEKVKTPTRGVGEVVGSEEGLKRALSAVRLVQNYAAVGAEILILAAFAMSSLDVSVGGNLASISGLAWLWGAVFALGIDTCFVLSWVRVRQLALVYGKRRHLWWAIPLAAGMSFIVFQPVAIQQLQQSLHISFEQALSNLGVNLGFLVYARSGVAVFLGAVLALTNVESRVEAGNEDITPSLSDINVTTVTPAEPLQLAEPVKRFSNIYKMVDPRTSTPFYVGQTSRPIEERLRQHIISPTNRGVRDVMDALEALDIEPTIELIERVPSVDADQKEQYWIAEMRSEGHELANIAVTGSSPETRVREAIVKCPECNVTEIARRASVPRSTADSIMKRIKSTQPVKEEEFAS